MAQRKMLISKPTLAVIKNALTVLCTHTTMSNLLEQYGFEQFHGSSPGNKLERAGAYLDHADWSDPAVVKNLLDALTHRFVELSSLGSMDSNEDAGRIIKVLEEREGITWDGEFHMPGSAALHHAGAKVRKFDSAMLNKEMERILGNVDRDPDDAITSAKSLVESTCRRILADFNEEPSSGTDILDLLRMTMSHLQILPEQISEKAKGANAIKKVLRSMTSAVQGLAELRNLYGDPHGKGPRYKGLEPRHACLAATLAGAVATFILEVHEHRQKELMVSQ